MGITYIKNYLFAEPSAIEGIARVLDLGATLQDYNYEQTPEEADIKAIANDWVAVGGDISNAIKKYYGTKSATPKK